MTNRVTLYEGTGRVAMCRPYDDKALDSLRGKQVLIWSGEHHGYWGPDWCGYYDKPGAGIYEFGDAYLHVSHCSPEKKIAFEPVEERQPDPGPYRAIPCPCGHRGCSSWMVEPVADVQGTSFTEAQARVVAALLNGLSRDRHHMHPYDQLLHDMVGQMCSALQYMRNAVEINLPLTREVVERERAAFKKLIERWHEMRRD